MYILSILDGLKEGWSRIYICFLTGYTVSTQWVHDERDLFL